MLDGKNSLEKKKRTIFRAGFILRNLFYLFERGEGEGEREGEKSRIVRPKIYTEWKYNGNNVSK